MTPNALAASAIASKSALPRLLPLAVWMVAVGAQFLYLPDTDTTWLLTIAGRLLNGDSLYTPDIVEENPPLVMHMMVPVVWLARWLDVDAITVWRLVVAGAIAGVGALVSRMLRGTLRSGGSDLHAPIVAVIVTLLACLPGHDYGQREHLVLLGIVPYVVLSTQRAVGESGRRGDRILAGVLLGLALWIKPYHALIVVVVEVGVVIARRSLAPLMCPELLAGIATGGLYGAYVLWRLTGFFTLMMPLVFQFYGAYGSLELRLVHASYLLIALPLVAAVRVPKIAAVHARMFFLAGVGAWLAFVVQDKGFPYHALPAKCFFLIAAGTSIAALVRPAVSRMAATTGPEVRRRAAVGASAVLLGLAVLTVARSVRFAASPSAKAPVLRLQAAIERAAPPHESLRLMSLGVDSYPAFPLVAITRAEWSSRFMCLWLLPGVIVDEQRTIPRSPWMRDGRQFLLDAVVGDFERWRPNVVIVPRDVQWRSTGRIDVLEELRRDERFRALWAPFTVAETVDRWDVFVHPTG